MNDVRLFTDGGSTPILSAAQFVLQSRHIPVTMVIIDHNFDDRIGTYFVSDSYVVYGEWNSLKVFTDFLKRRPWIFKDIQIEHIRKAV
jgi:hypothetical protein